MLSSFKKPKFNFSSDRYCYGAKALYWIALSLTGETKVSAQAGDRASKTGLEDQYGASR